LQIVAAPQLAELEELVLRAADQYHLTAMIAFR
jgi:hypothetical protein